MLERIIENGQNLTPTIYNVASGFSRAAAVVVKDDKLAPAEKSKFADLYAMRTVALIKELRDARVFIVTQSLNLLRTDTNLNPLRGRDDFKKLMTEIEAKSSQTKP